MMKHHMLRTSMWTLFGLFALLVAVLSSQPAVAQQGSCIDDVTGRTNVCAAGDVWLSRLRNAEDITCMPGEPVTLNLEAWLLATSLERYDIGIFLALDGGTANTGSCQHTYLPPPLASGGTCSVSGGDCKKDTDCPAGETCAGGYDPESGSGPFYDAEPEDAPDECGDLEPVVNTRYFLPPVTVPCIDSDGDGLLDIGTAVSWDPHSDNTCENVGGAIPNTPADCHYWTIDVTNVSVNPGRSRVQKVPQPEQLLEPGGWVTFTFVVENTSPVSMTLQGLVDSVYGPLEQAGGDCTLPQTLAPAAAYTCAISVEVTGEPGIHENSVTAWGTDWHKIPVTGTAGAEVLIVGKPPDSGMGMSAAVITGGMAAVGSVLLLAGALLRRRTA
ncbi:MAG: hypothetical protein PVI80_22775 [Anaerolineae bacterium]|jgi:hypothetical protein